MTTYRKDQRRAKILIVDDGHSVDFFEEEQLVGRIDYFDKHISYVEDACENWVNGIMSKDVVIHYSGANQLEFDFDTYQGGVENFG